MSSPPSHLSCCNSLSCPSVPTLRRDHPPPSLHRGHAPASDQTKNGGTSQKSPNDTLRVAECFKEHLPVPKSEVAANPTLNNGCRSLFQCLHPLLEGRERTCHRDGEREREREAETERKHACIREQGREAQCSVFCFCCRQPCVASLQHLCIHGGQDVALLGRSRKV